MLSVKLFLLPGNSAKAIVQAAIKATSLAEKIAIAVLSIVESCEPKSIYETLL